MPGVLLREVDRALKISEHDGIRFVEGPENQTLMVRADDVKRIVEECFSNRINRALLFAANMTPRFFDLSSLEAGAILQKLANYRIRLAVVCEPGKVEFSSRFPEMALEEKSTGKFGVFETRDSARDWLVSPWTAR